MRTRVKLLAAAVGLIAAAPFTSAVSPALASSTAPVSGAAPRPFHDQTDPFVRGVVLPFGDADTGGPTSVSQLGTLAIAGSPTGGFWVNSSDGDVGAYAGANPVPFCVGCSTLAGPIVAMTANPTGQGFWSVASDGGVFTYGGAGFHGSAVGIQLAAPVVGMAATATGNGYWLVSADGGVFSFGDARFFGSASKDHLDAPVVGMASTPTGQGYWLVASDGGVFSYGDAAFHGSAGNIHLAAPVVGIAATPTGDGYWLAASDGGVFSYGGARFFGSDAHALGNPVLGIARTAHGAGYWLLRASPVIASQVAMIATQGYVPTTRTAGPDESLVSYSGLCDESGDGHCWAEFFFVGPREVGTTSDHVANAVIVAPGPFQLLGEPTAIAGDREVDVSYGTYDGKTFSEAPDGPPDIYRYQWDGRSLLAIGSPPPAPFGLIPPN
jgi:hypothetical protein